jgi:hypothetical protein
MSAPITRRRARFRPCLEALEDRLAPAIVSWTGLAGDGNWSTPANWSSRAVPTAADDVLISGTGTITHGNAVSDRVHSIQGDQLLVIAGGTLTMVTSSRLGHLTLQDGELKILNGTLKLGPSSASGGSLFQWTGGTLAGPGTIQLFGTIYLNGGTNSLALDNLTLENYGTLSWTGGHIASTAHGGGANSAEVINEAGASFTVQCGSQVAPSFLNAGRLDFRSAGIVSFAAVANYGALNLLSGTLSATSFTQYGGTTTLAGGTLKDSSTLLLDAGKLTGLGTIASSVDNVSATVAPSSGQDLMIVGNYYQGSGGALSVTVSPGQSGSAPLSVQGIASLNGSLSVGLNSSVPGDCFSDLLDATTLSGQFASARLPSVNGYQITTKDSATAVYLIMSSSGGSSTGGEYGPSPGTSTSNYPTVTAGSPTASSSSTSVLKTGSESAASGQSQTMASSTGVREAGGQSTAGQERFGGPDPSGFFVTAVGGTNAGPAAANRPTEQAIADISVGTTVARSLVTGSPSGADRSAGRTLETDGGGDDLLATFRLMVPEVELPSEKELLSAGDVAAALLVGGRSRTDVLPRSGSQLSVVATVVTGDEEAPTSETQVSSPLNDLFFNPLMRRFRPIGPSDAATGTERQAPEATPAVTTAARDGPAQALRLPLLATTACALVMLAFRRLFTAGATKARLPGLRSKDESESTK